MDLNIQLNINSIVLSIRLENIRKKINLMFFRNSDDHIIESSDFKLRSRKLSGSVFFT